jgi:hypothetical protein
LQFDGEFIKMNSHHKRDWDEVESQRVAEFKKMLREGAATNPLYMILLAFVEAGGVIAMLDGRHR